MAGLRKSSSNLLRAEIEGQLTIHIADVGPTGLWGRPVGWQHRNLSVRALNARSSTMPPRARCCYDVFLVDGRFRVASAVAALRLAHNRSVMLLHDAAQMGTDTRNYLRPLYPWYEVERQVDTLLVLRPRPNAIWAATARTSAYNTSLENAYNDFMR